MPNITSINFTFEEVFASSYANQWKIDNKTSDPKILNNAVNLMIFCLQPIRNKIYQIYKKGVNIEGWFRSKALISAAAKKGIIMSDSLLGHAGAAAADISVSGLSQKQLFDFICQMKKAEEIEVDQLIYEKDTNCLHIGWVKGKNRNQIMIRDKVNGKFVYTNYTI